MTDTAAKYIRALEVAMSRLRDLVVDGCSEDVRLELARTRSNSLRSSESVEHVEALRHTINALRDLVVDGCSEELRKDMLIQRAEERMLDALEESQQ